MTINEATSLLGYLQNPEFCFWLDFFHLMMPHVDILFNQLQNRNLDASKVQTYLSSFTTEVNKIRDSVGSIEIERDNQNSKRINVSNTQTRVAAAKEVCDVILTQKDVRFQFTDHLCISTILQETNFSKFSVEFPEKMLHECVKLFPFFDKEKLHTELSVIYSRDEFRNIGGCVNLVQYIRANNLVSTFSEVLKLSKIAITLALTTSEPERCFSALKRIKNFLRNTMAEDRLSALAMLSIGKEMIQNIPRFNERVMDKFAAMKGRRMEFIFK
ncbi:hypothetical protein C0J52_06194 [Blattella germanica]|nr:hypothetical protein C0J52_06194 [Blattella germanica]